MDLEINFWKVFRNQYLKFQITKHINLYKENQHVKFRSVKDIQEYQYRGYIQKLSYYGEDVLSVGDLPENGVLETVVIEKLDYALDKPEFFNIPPEIFPSTVKSITYPSLADTGSTKLVGLPKSVTYVKSVLLETPVTGESIPHHIKEILWQFSDIELAHGGIPSTVRKLHFCSNLGKQLQIGDISEGVEVMCFGGYPINPELHYPAGIIPDSVRLLRIHHPIFPDNIDRETVLANRYLPKKHLENLHIECFSGCHIYEGFIPPCVSRLTLVGPDYTFDPFALQSNCNINYLLLNWEFNIDITIGGFLPTNTLKTLIICSNINIEHGSLPLGLETFKHCANGGFEVNNGWNQKFEKGFFPESLTYLDLGKSFDHALDIGDLPNGLLTLKFGRFYSQSFPVGVLPLSLTELDTGNCDVNPTILPGAIPSSVTSLTLSPGFSASINSDSIPSTVTNCYYYGNVSPNVSFIPTTSKLLKKTVTYERPNSFI